VKQFASRIEEAKVDEMSEQSFPASDPPAGTVLDRWRRAQP
jgi:hypothetical protein